HLRKDGGRDAGQSVPDERPQNRAQAEETNERGNARETEGHGAEELAERQPVHADDSALRLSRISISRAAGITAKVMTNSTTPSATSEELYRSPVASVNSLAMDAEMVVPGASSEGLMRCALPMTKVTAMVSPSARPRPSMMPPMVPARV